MEITKKEWHDIRSESSGNPPNHSSIGGNNIEVFTTNNAFSSHVLNNLVTASSIQHSYSSSAFHPVKNDLSCAPHQASTENADYETSVVLAHSKGAHKEHHTQHLHIHYDNHQVHHHLVHSIQKQQPTDDTGFSLKTLAAAGPHCGSSNILSGPVEGKNGNCSINRSASGSNLGSSAAINVGGANIESDNGISGKSGCFDASGSGRVDENKSAKREAALTKFRQKRKERCFHKKVIKILLFEF